MQLQFKEAEMWVGLMECRSFQELGDLKLPSKIGCGHVFIASWMPTAKVCFCPECKMEILIQHQYGMISKLLEQESRKAVTRLTSSLLAFLNKIIHARISALQALEKAWQESEADYFSRSLDCVAKLSQNGYFLRTQKESCQTGELKLLKRLPPSGIAAVGLLRAVKRLDHPKIVIDGFVWPTPTASQASKPIREPSPSRKKGEHGYDLQDKIGEIYPNLIGKRINPRFLEWMMSYPLGWTELSHWVIPYVSSKQGKLLKN